MAHQPLPVILYQADQWSHTCRLVQKGDTIASQSDLNLTGVADERIPDSRTWKTADGVAISDPIVVWKNEEFLSEANKILSICQAKYFYHLNTMALGTALSYVTPADPRTPTDD